jgi:ATP-dependent RNA helicase DeaD
MTDPNSAEPATTPPPTFEILPLSRETLDALASMGYTHPTPVQRVVFEPAARGADLVVQARTGTGKTAAFGLPIVETVVRRKQRTLQVIVLCPTRELALQVTSELGRLALPRGIEPVAIYGGAPMGKQTDALAGGAQIVVGTPGRVLDHLQRGTMRADDVRMLVLDEADEMLSMGFERELSAILERLPKSRQTLLFSATVPPDIERIARDRLRSPEFITLSGDHVGALEILHFVYVVTGDKIETLLRVIEVENPESALVFCNTKADTERVAEALERQGFAADWLNGDLPQGDREKVMARTREGKLRFLVATDVAARGIDISHLSHVINFDFPETAEQYIHRTGRTGRMGRTGSAISLIAPKNIGNLYLLRLTYKIRPIERQLPTEGELKTRAEADLVQLLADAFLPVPAHPDDLALARRLLSHDGAEQIVAGLVRDHLGVRADAADVAAAARRSKMPPPQAKAVAPASLADWAPPAEPGDDQPIFRETAPKTPAKAPEPRSAKAPEARSARAPEARSARAPEARSARAPEPRSARAPEPEDAAIRWTEQPHGATPRAAQDAAFAEIFVSVGRHDGVTADDLQRVLTEMAQIPASDTGRIRVRDRNAFVSVKREMLDRALAALNGAAIAGKVVQAELAKPRSS